MRVRACPQRDGPDESRGANRMNIQHVPIRTANKVGVAVQDDLGRDQVGQATHVVRERGNPQLGLYCIPWTRQKAQQGRRYPGERHDCSKHRHPRPPREACVARDAPMDLDVWIGHAVPAVCTSFTSSDGRCKETQP